MGESKIEATLGAEASGSTTEHERIPRSLPSEMRATRDAARSREATSQGATPSVPGKKLKMFIILSFSELRPHFRLMWWIKTVSQSLVNLHTFVTCIRSGILLLFT